jgi:hypothetical protein
MRFYLTAMGRGRGSHVLLLARAESEDGGTIGDCSVVRRKGESFAGVSYERMRKLGGGIIQLDSEGRGFIVEAEA